MKRLASVILMKKLCFSIVLFLGCAIISIAQPALTRTGSYVYVASPDQSPEAAKKIALERAKQQILENEFGTVVGVSNISRIEDVNGESSSSFVSVSGTEVKGEWISTVGTPRYEISFQGESLVVKVTVTGVIREIKSSSIELDIKILRNGVSDRNESDFLKDADDFFILFKSPVKGYVAVYQYDSDGVFRLLPYYGSDVASIPVKGGKEYVFFSQESTDGAMLRADITGDSRSYYKISCDRMEDLCRYYIIFSPNNFSIANDGVAAENIPAQLDFESFQKWLGRVKKQDKDMVVTQRDVALRKK